MDIRYGCHGDDLMQYQTECKLLMLTMSS